MIIGDGEAVCSLNNIVIFLGERLKKENYYYLLSISALYSPSFLQTQQRNWTSQLIYYKV